MSKSPSKETIEKILKYKKLVNSNVKKRINKKWVNVVIGKEDTFPKFVNDVIETTTNEWDKVMMKELVKLKENMVNIATPIIRKSERNKTIAEVERKYKNQRFLIFQTLSEKIDKFKEELIESFGEFTDGLVDKQTLEPVRICHGLHIMTLDDLDSKIEALKKSISEAK